MSKAGLWQPYLDEPAMFTWYALPADLQAEWDQYQPDGTELDALPSSVFAAMRNEAIAYARASVGALPYHNDPNHFEPTERYGMAAVRKFEQLSRRSMPMIVKQAGAVALRLHDCHHCGSAFRADAAHPSLLHRLELGTRVSSEWVSAQAINQFSRRYDLPVPARLFQTMIVWCSTIAGHTPRGQELGIPVVEPQGLWGWIMRSADICPPDDFLTWIANAAAVKYAEIPAEAPPLSRSGFLEAQIAFTDHIESCFDQLDAVTRVPLTRELGWRRLLRHHRLQLERVIAGREPALSQAIDGILAIHGPSRLEPAGA